MGKGSKRRKGDDPIAYRKNFIEPSTEKKQSACWKCNDSWQCKNAYIDKECKGLKK